MTDKLSDEQALAGADSAKVIWDINAADGVKLTRLMNVIGRTYDDLLAAGATPQMVFAFRGPSVTFLTARHQDHTALAEKLKPLLERPNVRMEICGVAAANQGVVLDEVMAGIEPVNNTFVSLIGWQQQGYALIHIT